MEIDWEQYRTNCQEQRAGVLERFGDMLLRGAGIATVQSAPVYTGQLTAVLVTVLRQMTDTLKMNGLSTDESAAAEGSKMVSAGRDHIRQEMKRRFFSRLSGIEELAIAQEYMRTHFQYQLPRREEMTEWLLSFQGRSIAVQELVRKIDKETDSFIREDVPKIVEASQRG